MKASKNGFFSIELRFTQPWYLDSSNQKFLIQELIKHELVVYNTRTSKDGSFYLSLSWAGFKGGRQLFSPPSYTINKPYLTVFGATGLVGKSILNSLLPMQPKYNLRATGYRSITDIYSLSTHINNYPGVDFLYCDYSESSIRNAMGGASIVILILPVNSKRIKICKTVIEIAKISRTLKHFIFISSIREQDKKTKWSSQFYHCEELLKESGLSYTIVQLSMLQQMFFPNNDMICLPTRKGRIPVLDVNDVAECIKKIIMDLEHFENTTVSLTGPTQLKGKEMEKICSDIMQKEIRFISPSTSKLRENWSSKNVMDSFTIEALLEFFEDHAQGSYNWNTDDLERILERRPTHYHLSLANSLGITDLPAKYRHIEDEEEIREDFELLALESQALEDRKKRKEERKREEEERLQREEEERQREEEERLQREEEERQRVEEERLRQEEERLREEEERIRQEEEKQRQEEEEKKKYEEEKLKFEEEKKRFEEERLKFEEEKKKFKGNPSKQEEEEEEEFLEENNAVYGKRPEREPPKEISRPQNMEIKEIDLEDNKPVKVRKDKKGSIFESSKASKEFIVPTSLTDFVFSGVSSEKDQVAILNPSFKQLPKISYKALYTMIKKAAIGLSEQGFQKGDVLAIFSYNHHDYLVSFFASAMLGGVSVLIPRGLSEKQLASIFENTKTSYIATVSANEGIIKSSLKHCKREIKKIWYFFASVSSEDSFWNLMKSKTTSVPQVSLDAQKDVVLITFPQPYSHLSQKETCGVRFTHSNITASILQLLSQENNFQCDKQVSLVLLPFYTNFSFLFSLYFLHKRGSLVVQNKFKNESILQFVKNFSVTHLLAVPPHLYTLSNIEKTLLSEFDVSSLKFVLTSYTPLTTSLLSSFRKNFDTKILQFFTHPASFISALASHANLEKSCASFGSILPGVSLKISDKNGEPLKASFHGEICFKGPNVASSFTKDNYSPFDKDGFLQTGLVGLYKDNQLFVVDFKAHLFDSFKGLYKYPSHLESLLFGMNNKEVLDLAVGKEDQKINVFVVRSKDSKIDEKEFKTSAAKVDKIFEKIGRVHFVNEITKNRSGIVERDDLN